MIVDKPPVPEEDTTEEGMRIKALALVLNEYSVRMDEDGDLYLKGDSPRWYLVRPNDHCANWEAIPGAPRVFD